MPARITRINPHRVYDDGLLVGLSPTPNGIPFGSYVDGRLLQDSTDRISAGTSDYGFALKKEFVIHNAGNSFIDTFQMNVGDVLNLRRKNPLLSFVVQRGTGTVRNPSGFGFMYLSRTGYVDTFDTYDTTLVLVKPPVNNNILDTLSELTTARLEISKLIKANLDNGIEMEEAIITSLKRYLDFRMLMML